MENANAIIVKGENLSIGIGREIVLQDLNFEIPKGTHWLIIGKQGAGKSVFCQMLAGRHRVAGGRRRYPFFDTLKTSGEKYQKIQAISFTDYKLFRGPNAQHYYQQRYNAFDASGHMTVSDYLSTVGFEAENARHQNVLDQLGIRELIHTERIKLSSGQTRKLLLAKALISEPAILILDNAYIGLDAESRETLNRLLDEIVHQYAVTLIIASNFTQGPKCMSHFLELEHGQQKSTGEIKDIPKQYLEFPQLSIDHPFINKARRLKPYFQTHTAALRQSKVVELSNVTIKYGTKQVLGPLDWRVLNGEKWVIKGNNGSGKSTLISLIYGDHPQAYAQKIRLFEQPRGKGESIWDIKSRIGFTSSEIHAYFDMPLNAEQLVFSGFHDGFFVKKHYSEAQRQWVHDLFDCFDLLAIKAMPFRHLSIGTQRLLFLIRALVKCPPVLLLDEPFQGMDGETIAKAKFLLDEWLNEKHTLIFVSHFLREIPENINRELAL